MRRSLLVVFVIVGAIPLLFFVALHFAQLPEVTFEEALRLVAAQPSEERAPKVMVRGTVHALPQSGQISPTFWMQDRQGQVFAVEYTGGEALPVLQVGQSVVVVGHAHGGSSPYFHASEVRKE
ncbi:MAG: hypothetical protein NZ960_04790 [Candidatus Kapabacteria bacterium]|nr:hypothetical protein [Candidatus Kapabacteria bacterium]MDW8012035.1 hypothetical protein [Bacteroidota bacterium]